MLPCGTDPRDARDLRLRTWQLFGQGFQRLKRQAWWLGLTSERGGLFWGNAYKKFVEMIDVLTFFLLVERISVM